jgi:hypothetical protein
VNYRQLFAFASEYSVVITVITVKYFVERFSLKAKNGTSEFELKYPSNGGFLIFAKVVERIRFLFNPLQSSMVSDFVFVELNYR